jgi:phospho-N-acetylmuramoyl-pentapeptide-transferase
MIFSFCLTKHVFWVACLAFLLSAFFLFVFIELAVFKEKIREELEHKIEQENTPTAGGLVFIPVFILSSSLLYHKFTFSVLFLILINGIIIFRNRLYSHYKTAIIIIFCLLFLMLCNFSKSQVSLINIFKNKIFVINFPIILGMLIGLFDDCKKKATGTGLSELILLVLQSFIGLVPVLFNVFTSQTHLQILQYKFDPGLWYIPIAIFIFNGTVNSVNLTDGVNGGLTIPSIIISIFFISHYLKSVMMNCNYVITVYDSIFIRLAIIFIASIIPFLFFNLKNKIFMGNAGSMGIGVFIASFALLMKTEILIPLYGLLLMIETISVILQRYYYKMFKERIFLFTPIHHHFEKLGWSNSKILLLMGGVTCIGCIIALILI